MKTKKFLLLLLITTIFSSCATIFIPKKQKVTFNTGSSDSEVYVDKEMIGDGTTFTTKMDKSKGNVRQVVVKRKGFKDQYTVMAKTRLHEAYIPLKVLFIWNPYTWSTWERMFPKNWNFDKQLNLKGEGNKLVNRTDKDKYISISNIKLDIKNQKKDLVFYHLKHDPLDITKACDAAEKKADTKADMKEAKQKNKKGAKTLDDNDLKYEDTKFSYNVYETLKKTGFIDTVNQVFNDDNNTVVLEGKISRISTFRVYVKGYSQYYKAKVYLKWYIKNTYNEILDSITTNEYSGDFAEIASWSNNEWSYDGYGKMIGDAIDLSYLKLHKNAKITKYLKMESDFASKDATLTIKTPSAKITDKGDAAQACVSIKVKDGKKDMGHGSGFAISQDGYILTNYHVIAGKTAGKYYDLTVIDSDGKEMPVTVVRTNKYRDLALLKVDHKFAKAFAIGKEKTFKKMQDVFTIGTPKSIELGQSVSTGIISNERKTETTNLIQLSMSVNAGNSGGPLFDGTGTLHGVIVSKLVGQNTEGVSFAIPAYMIQEYLNINFN